MTGFLGGVRRFGGGGTPPWGGYPAWKEGDPAWYEGAEEGFDGAGHEIGCLPSIYYVLEKFPKFTLYEPVPTNTRKWKIDPLVVQRKNGFLQKNDIFSVDKHLNCNTI